MKVCSMTGFCDIYVPSWFHFFLFWPLLGEMIQFDEYFFRWVGSTTNQVLFHRRHIAKPLVWCKPWSLPIVPQEPTHFRLYALSPGKQRTTDPALLFVPGHGGSGVPRKSHLLLLGVYWGDASSSASLKKKEANCCINRLHPFLILLFFEY